VIKTPILSFDGYDVMVFETVEAAERFVEPPDVDDGVTYDAEGRLLAFETDGRRTSLHERESEPTHERELRDAITRAMLAAGTEVDGSAPLERLVAEALARFKV
jgi:hypothetical protein